MQIDAHFAAFFPTGRDIEPPVAVDVGGTHTIGTL
jgi:hypothetical protein